MDTTHNTATTTDIFDTLVYEDTATDKWYYTVRPDKYGKISDRYTPYYVSAREADYLVNKSPIGTVYYGDVNDTVLDKPVKQVDTGVIVGGYEPPVAKPSSTTMTPEESLYWDRQYKQLCNDHNYYRQQQKTKAERLTPQQASQLFMR